MHTEVETVNSYSKRIKVQLSPEDLAPIEKKVLRNYQKTTKIPGFRPGKAPVNLVRQRYQGLIQQDLMEETMKQYYLGALQETSIEPVSQGKITDLQFENIQSGMSFEIEVEVEPEFDLQKYKDLQVEKDVVEVTDEMVEDSLARLREQYATVKEVDQAKDGHFLHFTAQELDEAGFPIVGHKHENLQVQLGSGKFDADIESQLIGIKKGEKRVVRQESPSPNLQQNRPQITTLEIEAIRIEEKDFPPLDDEFVKNLDEEDLHTLDQLKERLTKNLELEFKQRSERTLNNRIIDELLKANPFEIPPSLVESYLNEWITDIKKQSPQQPVDEDAIRKEYRANIIHDIRWYFLKKKIMEAENISVSDEEAVRFIDQSSLDEKNKSLARSNPQYLKNLKEDLLDTKILNMLKEHAQIVEVYPMQSEAP